MKNILIATVLIIGLTIMVTQSTPVKANNSAISISASLSGTGSTTASVTATDETTGQVHVLTRDASISYFYWKNGVSSNYYTIKACASTSSGIVTHVNFNTTGYITMQNGACIPD
jgi:hypothetical protein